MSGGGQRKQRLGFQEGFEKREWERNKVTENPSTYFPAGSGRAWCLRAHAHARSDQPEDLSFSLFSHLMPRSETSFHPLRSPTQKNLSVKNFFCKIIPPIVPPPHCANLFPSDVPLGGDQMKGEINQISLTLRAGGVP